MLWDWQVQMTAPRRLGTGATIFAEDLQPVLDQVKAGISELWGNESGIYTGDPIKVEIRIEGKRPQ